MYTLAQPIQSSLASLQTIAIAAESLCKARVVLYATWGYKRGDPTDKTRFPDFATMHAKTTRGYMAYALEVQQQLNINATIGPAGTTFMLVHAAQSSTEAKAAKLSLDTLLQDEKHPSRLGAFAAALSLANSIMGTCLRGSVYTTEGVSVAQAALLQRHACVGYLALTNAVFV